MATRGNSLTKADAKLKKKLGLADVCAISLSASIGVSIFAVAAPAVALAGPAILAALSLAAIPMLIFSVVYAFMSTALPRTGASYVWPTLFVDPAVGFHVSWLRIAGAAGSLYLMATVFSDYLAQLVTMPRMPLLIVILTCSLVLNILGAGLIGRLAQWLVLIKLIMLGSFIGHGLPHINLAYFTPFAPSGFIGIAAAIPLLFGLYTGIESAAECGEEVRDDDKIIAKGLVISSLVALVIYFGTLMVTIGVIGAPAVSASLAPLGLAGAALSPGSALAVVYTALIAIAAAMNTLMMTFARLLFAMGRDGVLPESFGKLNSKFGTPHFALFVAYASSLACMALPNELLFLLLAANTPIMVKYGVNCLSTTRLLRDHPHLYRASGFLIRQSHLVILSWVGVACSALMILLGLTADWRPYALLCGWTALGNAYWMIHARHRRRQIYSL